MNNPEKQCSSPHNQGTPDILLELNLETLKVSHQQQLRKVEEQHRRGLENLILKNSLLCTDKFLKSHGTQKYASGKDKHLTGQQSAYMFATPQRSSSTPNLSSKFGSNKNFDSSCTLTAGMSQLHTMQQKNHLKDLRQTQEDLDWAECQKQFRVSPVPKNVLQSVYDDIVQKQQRARQEGRQQRKEFLLSMQKPFTFHQRDVSHGKSKPETNPANQSESNKMHERRKSLYKTATDPAISEQLKERERQRKIRIEMRAQEMLKTSSAPILNQGLKAENQTRIAQRTKSRILGFLEQKPSFQPMTNSKIPDFDRLYQAFQREAREKTEKREVTHCQPFHLRTSVLQPRHSRSNLDKSPSTNTNSLKRSCSFGGLTSLSRDTLPIYMSDAARKRSITIRKSIELRESREQENAEWMKKLKIKSQAMSKGVAARAKAMDPHRSLKEVYQEKLKQHRQVDQDRMKDYKNELKEMRVRVMARPFLFEQVSQKNAKNNAERECSNTLRQVGLDEQFVRSKGEIYENQTLKKADAKSESEADHSFDSDTLLRKESVEDSGVNEEGTEEQENKVKVHELS